MITIKLPYSLLNNDNLKIVNLQQQFSIVVRWAFNRFQENKNEKEIRLLSKNLNNIEKLDSWFIQCAIKLAQQIYEKNKDKKVIFGGKNNFIQRSLNKISKEEFQEKRLMNLISQGEKLQKGNRKFNLDIIQNNKIIFKPKFKEHFELQLPKLRKNYQKQLFLLEELSKNKKTAFTIALNSKNIHISFELNELKNESQFIQKNNRALGIDLNPNFIGISILEFNQNNNFKIIHKQCFDLSKLTIKSNEASNSKRSKYLQNKLQFETIETTKEIIKLCQQFQVGHIFVENLKGMKSFKFKKLNRLCQQKWLKNLFVEQLEKRCKIYNLKFGKIFPQYSSFIGNCQYNNFDPINASIELCRRGYNVFVIKNKQFYPRFFIKSSLMNLWKKELENIKNDWKELFQKIKNSKLRYRVSLEDLQKSSYKVFSFNSVKSKIILLKFFNNNSLNFIN